MQFRKDQTNITVWHSPILRAELLAGHFSNFSYDVHTHDTACLSLLTHGSIRIKMRGQEFTARSGDLYAIDADEPHAGWPLDNAGWHLRTLYVDASYLRSLVRDEQTGESLALQGPLIRDPGLTRLLLDVHQCSQMHGSPLYMEEQYIAFSSRLIARHCRNIQPVTQVGPEHKAVQAAKQFIDDTLDQQISLGDIAAAAGLPPFRLYRAFEKSMGMTPHAYQRQARVRLAIALIRSKKPLGDIALETGFSDQAHLNRWFRRIMGVTPGAYQKALAWA